MAQGLNKVLVSYCKDSIEMVQESDQITIHGDYPIENTMDIHKVAHRKSKGRTILDSKNLPQLEEHWQWTTLKRKKSSVTDSQRSDVQENDNKSEANGPSKGEFITHHMGQPTSDPPRLESSTLITHSRTIPSEETCYTKDFPNAKEKFVTGTNSKCAMGIPRLEMTKVKEIALQAKLEAGAYVCQECQVVTATSRGEGGFNRRYPCLLFFCIFLNVMSILSFLFCISILRTMFGNPAY